MIPIICNQKIISFYEKINRIHITIIITIIYIARKKKITLYSRSWNKDIRNNSCCCYSNNCVGPKNPPNFLPEINKQILSCQPRWWKHILNSNVYSIFSLMPRRECLEEAFDRRGRSIEGRLIEERIKSYSR